MLMTVVSASVRLTLTSLLLVFTKTLFKRIAQNQASTVGHDGKVKTVSKVFLVSRVLMAVHLMFTLLMLIVQMVDLTSA